MAMGTERSKALHNFTMPCGLRWGNQRFLRCMKVNSDGQISHLQRFNTNSDHPIQQRRTTREHRERGQRGSERVGPTPARFSDEDDDDDGIAATREKVMLDLQTAADKMKDAIFKDGLQDHRRSVSPSQPFLPPPPPPPPPPPDANCPWNLRTRRAASCKMPVSGSAVGGGNDKGLRVDAPRQNSGFNLIRPAATAAAGTSLKSPIQRSDGGGAAASSGEKKERAKFSVALSKRDIEEDFYAIVGHRPPRRPKKRARIIQKQLDTLFPGLWLTEVSTDMYKVIEPAP